MGRIMSNVTLPPRHPNARPIRVTASFADNAVLLLLEGWGIYRLPTYEGPTGISSVVLDAAERRDLQHVGFMGQAPHYLQDSENPAAIQALLRHSAPLPPPWPGTSPLAPAEPAGSPAHPGLEP